MRWNNQIYSWKKSKSDEIISFKFPFIDNRYLKTTQQVDDSSTRRVNDSSTRRVNESSTSRVDDFSTRRVGDSPTWWVDDDSLTQRVDDSPAIQLPDSVSRGVAERKKTASKSSFRTRRSSSPLRNSRKKIFCLKTSVEFIESLSLKSLDP